MNEQKIFELLVQFVEDNYDGCHINSLYTDGNVYSSTILYDNDVPEGNIVFYDPSTGIISRKHFMTDIAESNGAPLTKVNLGNG